MSALGQKRTSRDLAIYVCFRGNSGHWMSAFRNRCNFSPVMSAFGGKADSLPDLSAYPLMAKRRNSWHIGWHHNVTLNAGEERHPLHQTDSKNGLSRDGAGTSALERFQALHLSRAQPPVQRDRALAGTLPRMTDCPLHLPRHVPGLSRRT